MTISFFSLHTLAVHAGGPATAAHVATNTGTSLGSAGPELEKYVGELETRNEAAGGAAPGWFSAAVPHEIALLRGATSVAQFQTAGTAAMTRLAGLTLGNASSGVVLFLGLDGNRLACLKLDPSALKRMQVDTSASGAAVLAVAALSDVLPEPGDMKKGALYPSPSGADARVVDLTSSGDPAGYWTRFLGLDLVRPKVVAADLVGASVDALVHLGVPAGAARSQVSAAWANVAAAPMANATTPQQFVATVATAANVNVATAWGHVQTAEPVLGSPHALVTPDIAKPLRRVVQLGDGIVVSGPASILDQRLTELPAANGSLIQIQATQQPVYKIRR